MLLNYILHVLIMQILPIGENEERKNVYRDGGELKAICRSAEGMLVLLRRSLTELAMNSKPQ
jgi:hypothetical protein